MLLAVTEAVFNILCFYRHGQGAADAVNKTSVAGSSLPSSS